MAARKISSSVEPLPKLYSIHRARVRGCGKRMRIIIVGGGGIFIME